MSIDFPNEFYLMKTLKQFILESQVLGLYRNFLKITPRHYTEAV